MRRRPKQRTAVKVAGPLTLADMGRFYDPDEPVPDEWFREPYTLHGSAAEQAARYRSVRAYRRLSEARRAQREAATTKRSTKS